MSAVGSPVGLSMSDAIAAHIEARLSDVHMSMPGRVESYDHAKQRASVKPLAKRGYDDESGDRQVESYPVIPDVPIAFLGTGDVSMTWKLRPGDYVWLLFASCSLDKWKDRGGEVDPEDDRRFALSDAVCFPCVRPFSDPVPPGQLHDTALVIAAPLIHAGGDQELALKSDVQAIVNAISGAAVAPSDGGATFKANIIAALTLIPVGTAVLKGG